MACCRSRNCGDFANLEPDVSGVQTKPGFRAAMAAALVLEATMRTWASERWEPMACQE